MDKTSIEVDKLSNNRQRRKLSAFDSAALASLPRPQRALLLKWLKSSAERRNWDGLLRLVGSDIDVAESLSQALFDCGAAAREEELKSGIWHPVALIWSDYETLCGAVGMTTRNTLSATITASWQASQHVVWQRARLADAYQSLQNSYTEKDAARLLLLAKVNEWLEQGRSGTRRDFALFARGQTRQLSTGEWAWLHEICDLTDCGIERHEPALWLCGDLQLQIGERWLDIGAASDFVGLTPMTLSKLTAGKTSSTHYRLIENRTSFERIARASLNNRASGGSDEIVIWLPGYAPTWWRSAVGQLIAAVPAPVRISCDTDPDGVQIALNVAQVWLAKGLAWTAHAMGVTDIVAAAHKLPMSERDIQLANTLLGNDDMNAELSALLHWCISHGQKAEQENWP
jgi:DNA topoisomerase VI subunit A